MMRRQIDARTPEDLAVIVEEWKRLGMVGGNLAQLKALLVSDLAKWARVIKETGIRGD